MACSSAYHRNTKKIKKNGTKRVLNHEISEALTACKVAWWLWREAGEPSSKKHPLVIRMKQSIRLLRKSQRQAEAKRTSDKVERIMSSEGSDEEFYQLVKHQRKTSDAPLQFLCVEGKVLEAPDDICDGWSTHFGSLANPLEMDQFDNGAKLNYF